MNDFYQLIVDKNELHRFLDFLPETDDSNQYYVTLFGRKKYLPDHPTLKSDKTMLARWTSNKERFINKLEQKETRIGTYLGTNELAVPQEALACYMTPSPRDFRKVAFNTIKVFADKLSKDGYINPRQEVMNLIQTTGSKNSFQVFDIDSKDPAVLQVIREAVDNLCSIIETRGGFHILINPSDLKDQPTVAKNWYTIVSSKADVTGDALVPIPGTYQGGFVPRLIQISRKHRQ